MKKIILWLLALTLYASDIEWFYDYDETVETAQKEKKKILVFMTQPGCGSCEYMKLNVFTDPAVSDYLNARFVALDLSIYDEDVPEHLKVRITPVFHFLDQNGNPLRKKLIGGKTPPFFLELLKEVAE